MAPRKAQAWAATDSSGQLSPFSFPLREIGAEEMLMKVLYCGMDHTDLHQIRGELGSSNANYPLVPGHEVVGEVIEVGSQVKNFKLGDTIGVGGIIDSCGECDLCTSNQEQYCNKRILTYNDVYTDGSITRGGFSSAMVIHQRFAVKIPEKLDPVQAAPLLCAGVTAYSPLKQFMHSDKVVKGGILGLGGVGHLGALIAKGMGHHVTIISSSDKKREEALDHLKADSFVVSTNEDDMKKAENSLDYILDTVPAYHSLQPYISLLKAQGKMLMVGAAPQPLQFLPTDIIIGKKAITGSLMGSVEEIQELVEFWVENGLTSLVEVVKMEYVNQAFERMERNDVRYRFVVDVAGSNL